jgi:predicted lipoprotein with Yx(FWY)xxD motif
MNNQPKNSRIDKMPQSISILLFVVLFMTACQSAVPQSSGSLDSILLPTAVVPTKTTAPVDTPPPAPTNTLAPTATQTAAVTQAPVIPDASSSEATLAVADHPELGKILVDGNGMTLYMYTEDGPNQSNCSGICLEAWPPLLTQGTPILEDGVDDSLVGTAKLDDGSLIVTYNKMPLYLWYKDTKPGDATGQGNKNVWYVVSPDGKVVGLQQDPAVYSDDYSYEP